MDDETSSRIRKIMLDAGRRQRPPKPDAEAERRRMLASTLRLAGHTVSQNPMPPNGRAGTTPPNDPVPPDEPVLAGGDQSRPGGTVSPEITSETAENEILRNMSGATGHAASQYPDDASSLDVAMPPDVAELVEDALRIDGAAQTDGLAPFGDAVQSDEIAAIDAGPSGTNLLPEVIALPDDVAQPDEGDASGDSLIINDPMRSASGGVLLPERIGAPAPSGAAAANRSRYFKLLGEPSSTSNSPNATAGDDVDSMPAVDPSVDDAAAFSPLVLAGDSAGLHAPPAPGVKLPFPRPGAGPLFASPSEDGDRSSGAGGGGGSTSGSTPDGMPDSNGNAQSEWQSFDVTPVRIDAIQTEVLQKVIAMIESKVGQRIDELRHETFVSRAAWNAAFPR